MCLREKERERGIPPIKRVEATKPHQLREKRFATTQTNLISVKANTGENYGRGGGETGSMYVQS